MKVKPSFEVLLSCMNESDFTIAEKSRIESNLLIVNQYLDKESYKDIPLHQEQVINQYSWRKHNLWGKGLSKSRNYAIKNSKADICLLADNDEIFANGYAEKIIKIFQSYPTADVIVFHLENRPKRIRQTFHYVKFPEILKVSSWQIAFRRNSIVTKQIYFDERMGAGTGNGAEEETKFLLHCLKAKLQILNAPIVIGNMAEKNSSTWFSGMNEQFFENRGMTTRYIFGFNIAILYGIYYVIAKHSLYCNDIRMHQAWKALLRGILKNKLGQ